MEVEQPADGPGTVSVLLEGIDAGVAGRADTARRLLGAGAEEGDLPARLGRVPVGAGFRGHGDQGDLRPLRPGRVLATARSATADAGVTLDLRGSGGAGVLYGALPADADPVAVGSVVGRLRAECTALGGATVVLDAPAGVKAVVDTWGPVPALELMRRVKEQFDPERRLAPGRFVGGI